MKFMRENQFKILHSSLIALHDKIEILDEKLDGLTVETAKQEVRLNQLEEAYRCRKTVINNILVVIIGALITAFIGSFTSDGTPAHAQEKSTSDLTEAPLSRTIPKI